MVSLPQAVSGALAKLDDAEKGIVTEYIESLQSKVTALGGTLESNNYETADATMEDTNDADTADKGNDNTDGENDDFPPLYSSGDDMEKAGEYKMEAADLKSQGKWSEALEKYTQAVLCAPPSALLYANRATALLKLQRFKAAERDCNEALKLNPDSAKALRVRGKVRKELQNWEGALSDLSQAQTIDFDPDTVEDLKYLTEKHVEQEKQEAQERNDKEEKMRKRAEEIKKAQKEAEEDAAKERAAGGGGMPGMGGMGGMPGMGGMGGMPGMGGMGGMPGGMPGMGGMPGGMPGMGGLMEMLMSDPELQEAMKNPKVVKAFSDLMSAPGGAMGLMSNPAKMQELMSDPEVGPVLQKIVAKLGPSMMGGAGMGGGMPGGGGGGSSGGDDNIPDMDDIPEL